MKTFEKTFKKPLWALGFRPFFLMVIFIAIVPTSFWVIQFTGLHSFVFSPLAPHQWHANEMIFGFLMAAMSGFLLTASANWTGTRGISESHLFYLFLLFVLVRALMWFAPIQNLLVYGILSLVFPLILVLHLARLFIKTNNRRNLMLIVPLSVFTIAQVLLLSPLYKMGYELALYSVRFLLVVIAGRVIPFFTKKAIEREIKWNLPLIEKLTIFSAFLLIFEPLYRGNGPVGDFLWVILTFIAFVLNIYRLVNWRFVDSFKVKILFILYFSYLWIPIHFALNLALYFSWISDLGRVDLHALSYGCMGIMIFGMVHRVTLGHTGRKIYASGLSLFGYISIGFGALIRVFGPLCSPLNYILWVKISGVLWIVSFILLGIEIVPMLVCERVDKRV